MRDPTRRFSDRVESYRRFRPGYPPALIETLRAVDVLRDGDVVADVGSGTGLLTRPFLDAGHRTLAIEPNGPMRAAAEEDFAGRDGFASIDGRAEATGLEDASVDLIVAGQAFHWFDVPASRAEFSRILRPGGAVALIWNDRCTTSSPMMTEYDALLTEWGTDYAQVDHRRIGDDVLVPFFAPGGYAVERLDNGQDFDYAGLEGRLLSCSYVSGPGEPGFDGMLVACRALFDRHARHGRVRFEYDMRIYHARPGW